MSCYIVYYFPKFQLSLGQYKRTLVSLFNFQNFQYDISFREGVRCYERNIDHLITWPTWYMAVKQLTISKAIK